ncbi:MAG: transposase family protein, partial [Nitrososphaerales archaeon]
VPSLSYAHLSKKPSLFRSFTGLEVSEFDDIYREIESRYDEYERRRLSKGKKRERDVGAGHPFKLKLKDRVIMLLVYYRLYITYPLAAFLFDLDQSNVYRDIHMLEPLVKQSIPLPKKIYNMSRRARTIEEVERYFPGFKAFIDASEQEIPRPKNKRRRKSYYSGKRKRHTVKTQYMVNGDGLIIHRSNHQKGRKHDYAILKENSPSIPPEVERYVDLGYKGVQNDFPDAKWIIPVKKRRKRKLTRKERRYNRKVARKRVKVEHAISRVKKFNIMGSRFRNRLRHYDNASDIVCGLVNFRTMRSKGIVL